MSAQRSLDGMMLRRPAPVQPVCPDVSRPAVVRVHPRSATPAVKRRGFRWEMPLTIVLSLCAGLFASSEVAGQLAVVLYAAVALWQGIASRTTFLLALIAMGATVVMLVGQGNIRLAQSFATYTFLLLVAGVLSLGRELKKEGGRVYSIRTRTHDQ